MKYAYNQQIMVVKCYNDYKIACEIKISEIVVILILK